MLSTEKKYKNKKKIIATFPSPHKPASGDYSPAPTDAISDLFLYALSHTVLSEG